MSLPPLLSAALERAEFAVPPAFDGNGLSARAEEPLPNDGGNRHEERLLLARKAIDDDADYGPSTQKAVSDFWDQFLLPGLCWLSEIHSLPWRTLRKADLVQALVDAKVAPVSGRVLREFAERKLRAVDTAAAVASGRPGPRAPRVAEEYKGLPDGATAPSLPALQHQLLAAEARVAGCAAELSALDGAPALPALITKNAEARQVVADLRQAIMVAHSLGASSGGSLGASVGSALASKEGQEAALKALLASEGGMAALVKQLWNQKALSSPDATMGLDDDEVGELPYERERLRRLKSVECFLYLDPVACDDVSDEFLRFKAALKPTITKTKSGVMVSAREYRLPDTSANFEPARVKQGFERIIRVAAQSKLASCQSRIADMMDFAELVWTYPGASRDGQAKFLKYFLRDFYKPGKVHVPSATLVSGFDAAHVLRRKHLAVVVSTGVRQSKRAHDGDTRGAPDARGGAKRVKTMSSKLCFSRLRLGTSCAYGVSCKFSHKCASCSADHEASACGSWDAPKAAAIEKLARRGRN